MLSSVSPKASFPGYDTVQIMTLTYHFPYSDASSRPGSRRWATRGTAHEGIPNRRHRCLDVRSETTPNAPVMNAEAWTESSVRISRFLAGWSKTNRRIKYALLLLGLNFEASADPLYVFCELVVSFKMLLFSSNY